MDSVKFQAVIKSLEPRRPLAEPSSVGSPGSWSLIFGLPGGCASSRLDHGLKAQLFPIAANPFLQYLAPLGAKYMKKRLEKPVLKKKHIFHPSSLATAQGPCEEGWKI